MFNNIQFLNDLYSYCEKNNIKYYELSYTEQLAVMRSMLVNLSRSIGKRYKKKST
ncbi:MAG: hypothetical protein IJA23_00405 [Clostridia bacterium]|nr:hypothetical protein [Clostridia bacterium]